MLMRAAVGLRRGLRLPSLPSLLLFWLLALCPVTLSQPPHVRTVLFQPGDARAGCRRLCSDDPQCAFFLLEPQVNEGTKCFLLDETAHSLVKSVPDVFSSTINGTSGVHVTHLYTNPIATDSNVFSTTPQHFVRGCSYTIALWVWLYKPRVLPDTELVILSTREVMGQRHLYHDEALLPGIVFNVGGLPDRTNKFFFSATKDDFGSYHGFWAGNSDIRFHEWIHLTLAVTGDAIFAYINGEHAGVVSMSRPRQEPMYCPYISSPEGPHTPISFTPSPSPSSSQRHLNLTDAELQQAPYSFAPHHPSEGINNTVLQIAGSNAHTVSSTPGLFLDLIIVRNALLSHDQIRQLMHQREPPRMPHLQALLRAYGKYSLEGFSPIEYQGWANAYLQKRWGLCPEVVCGVTNLDEAYRLGPIGRPLPQREIKRKNERTRLARTTTTTAVGGPEEGADAAAAAAARPHGRQSEHEQLSEDDLEALYESGYLDEYLDDLPYSEEELEAIEALYAGGAVASDMYADGLDVGLGYTHGEDEGGEGDLAADADVGGVGPRGPGSGGPLRRGGDAARIGKFINRNATRSRRGNNNESESAEWKQLFPAALRSASSTMSARKLRKLQRLGVPLSTIYFDLEGEQPPNKPWFSHFFSQAKRWLGNYLIGTNTTTTNNSTSAAQSPPATSPGGIDAATLSENAISASTASGSTANATSYLDTVSELYNSAMLWLNDRHEDFADTAISTNLKEWTDQTLERAVGALTFALWLADEEKVLGAGQFWSFKSAPALSQPIHLALGFIAGYDALDRVRLPSDVGIYLTNSLGGAELSSLLGIKRASDNITELLATAAGVAQSSLAPDGVPPIIETSWLDLLASQGALFHGESGELKPELTPLALHILSLNDTVQKSAATQAFLDIRRTEQAGVAFNKVASALASKTSALPSRGFARETECLAAAAHYFPVAQFVAGHFGMVETGVGLLEDVRITSASPSAFLGHEGEDDELQLHHEAEAEAGDPHAQMWLGRRYFWGYGGLQPNPAVARRWFERAAAQGDAEGLYNMGVFHNNGQGGLPINPDVALDYFRRAANAREPFPMALHAVGQHHLRNDQGLTQNLTAAKEHFQKAAELGSADGHFSLAMMYRDGSAGQVNVPMCIVHLALAITLGHVRATNFLAHGLLDPESWFSLYVREQQVLTRVNQTSTSTPDPAAAEVIEDEYNTLWKFNASQPIYINLPHGSVVLPVPLGSGNTCSVALTLLKNIAENSHRPNDLSKEALSSYLAGDFWTALDLYDEAAALGVQSAMENSAWIYSLLMQTECAGSSSLSPSSSSSSPFSSLLQIAEQIIPEPAKATLQKAVKAVLSKAASANITYTKHLPETSNCEYYFRKMTARRWIQLANTGDYVARREMAHRHLKGDGAQGPIVANSTAAALLYALAAEQGDVHSVVNLAWMFLGEGVVFPANSTAARALLRAAADMELAPEAGHLTTTQGVASELALLYSTVMDWRAFFRGDRWRNVVASCIEVLQNLVTLSDAKYTDRNLAELIECVVLAILAGVCGLLLSGMFLSQRRAARRRPGFVGQADAGAGAAVDGENVHPE